MNETGHPDRRHPDMLNRNPPQTDRRRRGGKASRRGSVYVVVLSVVALIVLLGLSAMIALRSQRRMNQAQQETVQARLAARSAVDLALETVASDPDWRSRLTGGKLFDGVTLGPGSISVSLTEKPYGAARTDADTLLTVIGHGEVGGAMQRAGGDFRFALPQDDPIRAAVLARDPIAYWPLQETGGSFVADVVGRAHGKAYNDTALGVEGIHDLRLAADFQGTGQLIRMPHHTGLSPDRGSVVVWFRCPDTNDEQGILAKAVKDRLNGGHLSLWLNSRKINYQLQSVSSDFRIEAGGLQDGRWHHVVATFGSPGMRLYLDGTLVGSDSYAGGLGASSGGTGNAEPLIIGLRADKTENPFTKIEKPLRGQVSDVAFFDFVLTSDDARSLYDAGSNRPSRRLVPGTWRRVVE